MPLSASSSPNHLPAVQVNLPALPSLFFQLDSCQRLSQPPVGTTAKQIIQLSSAEGSASCLKHLPLSLPSHDALLPGTPDHTGDTYKRDRFKAVLRPLYHCMLVTTSLLLESVEPGVRCNPPPNFSSKSTSALTTASKPRQQRVTDSLILGHNKQAINAN